MRNNILAQVRRFLLRLALCLATAQAAASPIAVATDTQDAVAPIHQQTVPVSPTDDGAVKGAPVGMGWG